VNATGSARLELSSGISTNAAENITISGSGNFRGALTSVSGSNTWQGNVTIGAVGTRIGAEDGATLQVSGVIDSGTANTGVISRAGSGGGVILSGANTYLGDTQVLIGRLQLAGGDNRLPVGTTLTFGSAGTNANGEFDLNGTNQEVAGLSLLVTAEAAKNSVNNSSATQSTFTVNTVASASTFIGILRGNLALTKSGANSLTLTNTSNSYTGVTSITGGTLSLGANNVIADASNIVIGAGTLNADTFTDSVGTLDVTGTAAVNLGTGAALSFADSKAEDWNGGSLNILGTLGATSIRFGDSADDLTSAQLALISVNGSGAGTYILDANGYLVVGGGTTPYQTWASDKGLTFSNQANNLDPDSDGNNNLAEFAFNGNPLSGSDNGKIFLLTEDSDADVDTTKELILTIAVRSGTPAFAGSPTPSAVHPTDGLTYSIEGSMDLNGFPASVTVVPTAVTTGLPAAGAGYEYRSFSLDGSNDLSSKGFLRAKVTAP
jgi:autotransporter-associated beta strand protein